MDEAIGTPANIKREYPCPYCNADLASFTNPGLLYSSRDCPFCGKKIYWYKTGGDASTFYTTKAGWFRHSAIWGIWVLISCMIFVIAILFLLVLTALVK